MRKQTLLALSIAVVMIAIVGMSYATTLQTDDQNNFIQNPAYNGGKSAALTGASVVLDLRQDVAYSLYCAAVAKERGMYGNYTASGAASAGRAARNTYVLTPVPATTWHSAVVNKQSPFLNVTGCTGWVRRQ